jgi:hypothetical protein
MLGINRTDLNEGGPSFRNGQLVDLAALTFGTPVKLPLNVGNQIPSNGANVNTVDWGSICSEQRAAGLLGGGFDSLARNDTLMFGHDFSKPSSLTARCSRRCT